MHASDRLPHYFTLAVREDSSLNRFTSGHMKAEEAGSHLAPALISVSIFDGLPPLT